jgi:phosphatidylglycerol:prolipoprotein diacylglycerol transferase
MQPLPNGFDIPIPFLNQTFHIYFYGICITIGVVAAALLGQFEAKRRGYNTEIIWDALFWVVLAGILGARIWHILTPPPSMTAQGVTTQWYLMHPLEMINLRNGGLGIPGAIIGGAIALWFFCRKRKIHFLTWTDIIIPGVALAQAIGRWGNYFNQELYGLPTNLPWKVFIDPLHRVQGFQQYEYFHPVFLYESLWNLMNMAVLMILTRQLEKWFKPGDIFGIYMIIYAIGRFLLEFLRLDSSQVGGINFNQYFMILVAAGGGALLLINHLIRRPRAG